MKKRNQVLVAAGMVIAICIGFLVANHFGFSRAVEVTEITNSHVIPAMADLQDMKFGIVRIVASTNELLVLSASRFYQAENVDAGEEGEQGEKRLFNEGFTTFERAYESFAHHGEEKGSIGINHEDHLEHLKKEYEQLKTIAFEMIELSDEGFEPRRVSELKEIFEGLEQSTLSAVDTTFEHESMINEKMVNQAISSLKELGLQAKIIGYLMIAVLSLFSWFVISSLSRELKARYSVEEKTKQLQESEARFQALANYTPNKLHIKDTEGRYILINRKSEELFGVTNEEARGKTSADIFQLDMSKDFDAHDRAVMETGEPVEAEEEFFLADGVHTYLTVKFPIIGANDEIVAIGASGFEITERKKSEQEKTALQRELLQSSKLEAVGQLASGIAHEINTPIQYIGDNLKFLREASDDLMKIISSYQDMETISPEDTAFADKIKEAARLSEKCDLHYLEEEIPEAFGQAINGVEQVALIVSAMKEFSHPASKEQTEVDINKLVATTATVARNEWKYVADLSTEFHDDPLPILCLPGEMNQVLLNLIINAAHAIGEKIKDNGMDKGMITVSTRKDGPWAEIRISDSGSGIPEDIQDNIFTPFFTTKEVGKGSGQGLSISRDIIVNKHAGKMTFETEEWKGTTFIIRIPADGISTGVEG